MPEINKPAGNALNKIWASSGAISVPEDSKISTGWVVEAPPHEVENFLNNKHDTAIAHANQHGGFVWDGETEYIAGKSWTQGTNGVVYKCLVSNINQNPTLDVAESYWRPVLTGAKLLESSEVSAYMRTLLDDTSAAAARTTLGMTTTGQNIVTAAGQSAARTALGAGTNGASLFISNTAENSRSVIGVISATEFTEGLSQRASDAEAIAGVNDTKFLTSKKLKLGFSVSLTQPSGYIIFPSWLGGFQVRWGVLNVNGNSTASSGNIFTTACLASVVSIRSSSTGINNQDAPLSSPSGAAVVVVNPSGNINLNITYIAVGY